MARVGEFYIDTQSAHKEAAQRRLAQAGKLLNEAAREIARWAAEAQEPSPNAFQMGDAPRYGAAAMMTPTNLRDRMKFAEHVEQRALELLQSADALGREDSP